MRKKNYKKPKYYHHHHNNKNITKQKKNLMLDNYSQEEINNILFYSQIPQPEKINFEKKVELPKVEIPVIKAYELLKKEEVKEEEAIVPKQKKRNKINLNINKNVLKYGTSFALILLVLFGTSYSFFNYTKEDSRQADISSGEVYVRLVENPQTITLNKMYPREDTEARSRNDNYFDFTINAKNTSETKVVMYTININNGEDVSGKTRIDPQYIRLDLQEKVNNNYEYILEGVQLSDYSFIGTIPVSTNSEMTKEYRLRIWVSDNVLISDTVSGASYTQAQFNNLFATYSISVASEDAKSGVSMVRNAITTKVNAQTNSCNPVWVDDMGTANDETDDITYFSGTSDCVDMNYVWYSGKLWRITAIYPDGSMKLITQNSITTISFNPTAQPRFYTDANNTSYIYTWLNEEFYDTLYNGYFIVNKNKQWDITETSSVSTRPDNSSIANSKVGLLNAYEYYNSYRCIDSDNCTGSRDNISYLSGEYWWLINGDTNSKIWGVGLNESLTSFSAGNIRGVRPVINLNSNVAFTGTGTIDDPYKIVGDKETGIVNDKINTRLSGEYIKLKAGNNEQVFRIIDVEDNKTKIIALESFNNNEKYLYSNSRVVTSGTDYTKWGSGTTTSGDTCYTIFNTPTTGYFDVLKSTYGDLFDSGTYYMGETSSYYKLSICANSTSGNTKMCDKTTYKGVFNIGIPRLGEMFASDASRAYWLITPKTYKDEYYLSGSTGSTVVINASNKHSCRPTLHLKSTVKILSGTGIEDDPYVVGL